MSWIPSPCTSWDGAKRVFHNCIIALSACLFGKYIYQNRCWSEIRLYQHWVVSTATATDILNRLFWRSILKFVRKKTSYFAKRIHSNISTLIYCFIRVMPFLYTSLPKVLKYCNYCVMQLWPVELIYSANAQLPGCFCPWTFSLNIGLNTFSLDSFMSCLHALLGYSTGEL